MADWRDDCEKLWGADWIAPLSDVLGIARRTVERWKSGAIGAPRPEIQAELRRLAAMPHPEIVGRIVRRLAAGDTVATIAAEIEADRKALEAVAKALGTFTTIDVLRGE